MVIGGIWGVRIGEEFMMILWISVGVISFLVMLLVEMGKFEKKLVWVEK